MHVQRPNVAPYLVPDIRALKLRYFRRDGMPGCQSYILELRLHIRPNDLYASLVQRMSIPPETH
jgi:hypothetical protein